MLTLATVDGVRRFAKSDVSYNLGPVRPIFCPLEDVQNVNEHWQHTEEIAAEGTNTTPAKMVVIVLCDHSTRKST